MKFNIQERQVENDISLVYREEDYSFDVDPNIDTGFTSIMINDLQLEIDDTGKIIYVWGLCPLFKCEKTDEFPAKYKSRCLVALLNKPPVPGISYRLNVEERWPIHINKKKRWVCIGNPKNKADEMIEFVPDCIAALKNKEIITLWLRPRNLPELS